MKLEHGRTGEWNEYFEYTLKRPKMKVIALKCGDKGWHLCLLLVKGSKSINTFGTYKTSEDARFALDVAVKTIVAYSKYWREVKP